MHILLNIQVCALIKKVLLSLCMFDYSLSAFIPHDGCLLMPSLCSVAVPPVLADAVLAALQ